MSLPQAEIEYLEAVRAAVQRELAPHLLGLYIFGSAGCDAYEPGVSDLDVQAVVDAPLPDAEKRALAALLSHAVLPCPARKLEFVCYARGAVNPASRRPRFELNFNTGPERAERGQGDHLRLDPADEAGHWFLLDIAASRLRGLALHGPPPGEMFAPVPDAWRDEALLESLCWHETHEVREEGATMSANAILNACRAWQWAEIGAPLSKREAAQRALARPDCVPLVGAALRARAEGGAVADEDGNARVFLGFCKGRVEAKAAHFLHASP